MGVHPLRHERAGDACPVSGSAPRPAVAMVAAIEKEQAKATVRFWPWAPLGVLTRNLALSWVRKLG